MVERGGGEEGDGCAALVGGCVAGEEGGGERVDDEGVGFISVRDEGLITGLTSISFPNS